MKAHQSHIHQSLCSSVHQFGQFRFKIFLLLLVCKSRCLPALGLSRLAAGFLLCSRISTDCLVNLGVQVLHLLGLHTVLQVLSKVSLILLRIFFHHLFHIFSNMSTKDVLAEHFSIKLFGISVVSHKTLFVVRDVKTSVERALQSGEDLGSGGGSLQAGIEDAHEGTGSFVLSFDVVVFADVFGVALVGLVQAILLEDAPRDEETGAVRGGVVAQADLEAVARELVGVGGSDDDITGDGCIGDLADDVSVRETDDETILGGVVFVFVLGDETKTGAIIGLALASTSVLDLQERV